MNFMRSLHLNLAALSIICSAMPASASELPNDDEFFTVNKSNVSHKLAKTNTSWIDHFIVHNFPTWENDTFEAFEKVKNENGIAIDIGAWIGTTAIWLSNNFAAVIAIEPDTESIKYCRKNLEASGCKNVIVCEKAVTNHGNPVIFGPRLSMAHGDSLNGSTSFVKTEKNASNDYVVMSITLQQVVDEYIHKNPQLDEHKITFIKCDIEGGEEYILEDVLLFALANNCQVWMSFHADWWSTKKVSDFADLFKKFKVNTPSDDVVKYITENPFGSVLFEPITT